MRRFTDRLLFGLLLAASATVGPAAAQPLADIVLEPLATWDSGAGEGGAEIVAFEPQSGRLFVTSPARGGLEVLSLDDPSQPDRARFVDLSELGGEVTSVAAQPGRVAVTIDRGTAPGVVVFVDGNGRVGADVPVGAGPDALAFSPNGRWLVVANEGEPSADYGDDPEGSVAVIDLRSSLYVLEPGDVRLVTFDRVEIPEGVRIFGPQASPAEDLEPESVAVTPDSRRAWVTLQENNALAEIDLERARVIAIHALGTKDHSIGDNALDPSDRDGVAQLAAWPVRGMYQPDGVAVVRQRGRTLVLTANEGDPRSYDGFEEAERLGKLQLDAEAFPDRQRLQESEALGRLEVSTATGDLDGDGDLDELHAFGARSFSVWSAGSGTLELDSGREMEISTARFDPSRFNCDTSFDPCFDGRSDNRGPEPEGLVAGEIEGHLFVFVGLERAGGVMVFELERPREYRFVQWLNPRVLAGGPSSGDEGPEGLAFISADQSPTEEPLLVVANEISGTVTIYRINRIYRNR